MATIASQDSYVNLTTSYWAKNGGIGSQSTFSTITISTANIENATIADINNLFLSTQIIEAEEAFISSISTLGIYLDGNLLTTAPAGGGNELLLNGVPIATTSNISSLADWSFDPAISTVNMNGNNLINGSLISTNNINAGSGFIANLVCGDISTISLTVISTLHEISSISSLIIEAQQGIFSTFIGNNGNLSSLRVSTINDVVFPQVFNTVSTFNTASVSSLTASTINGVQFPGPVADASQWATFPAVSTVYSGAGATDDLNLRATRFLNANASGVNIVVDEGANVAAPASFSVTAQNGNRGNISLTANPGFDGVFGEINLTANGGTVLGVGTGGLIELIANTPTGTLSNATSAIKFSAAGINSYAGAIPSVGSLLGYNFIYGTLGVNLCAGLPSIVPNTPGTTYIYGTNGVTIGSELDTTSDIVQGAGGIYTTLVTGYWAGGVASPQNLLIRGRQIPVIGNSYVSISNVDTISFDSGASGAITGVVSINGNAYPPTATVPSDLVVSTLNSAQTVTTSSIQTNTETANDLFTTRLTVNGGQQNAGIVLQGNTSAPSISVPVYFSQGITGSSTLGLHLTSISTDQALTAEYYHAPFEAGSGVGNFAVNKLFLSQTGGNWATLQADGGGSSIQASVAMSISSIINVSTINGVQYPPASSGGIQSTIANAGSFVNIDGTGNISISTSLIPAGTHNLNVDVDYNITLQVENGGIYLNNNNAVSHVHLTGNGDVDLFAAGNNSIYMDYNGGIEITAADPGTVNITNLSTINGAPYPPVASATSSITNGGGFVSIDGAGAISSVTAAAVGYSVVSNNAMTFNATQNGILLQDTDFGASLRVYNGITVGANTSSFVIGSAVTSVSSLVNVSSINGALYPPPSPGGSPNGLFSTINVSSILTAPDVVAVSTFTVGDPATTEASYIYPRGGGTGDIIIIPGTYLGTSGNVSLQDPLGGFGGLQVGRITQLSSIYGIGSVFITSATSTLTVSSINGLQFPYTASTISTFNTASISSLSVSTINGLPPPVSSFGTASVSSLSVSSINGKKIQGPVWVTGGTYSTISVTISTTNTLVGYTSSISTTTTGKYLVYGSFTGTQVSTGTNQLAMSIGRTLVSNGAPSNNASTINLANGSGMQNNVGGTTGSKMMAASVVNAAQTGVQASVIDTPGGVGPYYYSIWAAGSVSNDLTSENIMLSVLQVAP